MQEAEIKAVFESIGCPLIERGMDELQRSKENFPNSTDKNRRPFFYKVTLSNGTAVRAKSTDGHKNAELE